MKLILRNLADEFIKSVSFKRFEIYKDFFEELIDIDNSAKAILITNNDVMNSFELTKLKNILQRHNIKLLKIYSNNRETVLSGKSLKINSTFLNIKDFKDESNLDPSSPQKDILHKGTVRSGDRISSNGDLFIVGDVNPGAIISAKNNVYVWGKLFGIAFAGKNGNKNAFIASLFLNPLQLRICEIVAIGPKEKLKQGYPEVAILEDNKIVIKPYFLDTKFK